MSSTTTTSTTTGTGSSNAGGLGKGVLGKTTLGKGGFGLNKTAQQAAPPIKLNESQRIEDIPEREVQEKFLEAFKKINGISTKVGVGKSSSVTPAVSNDALKNILEDKEIEEQIKEIRKQTESILLGDLMGVAHQVDDSKVMLEEIKQDYETNHNDVSVSSHVRQIPTPFITRYVNRIEKKAIDLSESLSSYESRFQSTPNIADDSQYTSLLEQQYDAILRLSAGVAYLKDRVNDLRTLATNKLKISENAIKEQEEIEESDTGSSLAVNIKRRYELFQQEEKKKSEKISEKTDLFGIALNATAAPQKKFGFGSGTKFGSGTGASATAGSTAAAGGK